MIVIGITGSIGMGKSTVAEMLRAMEIPVHDSDASVHELLAVRGKAVPLVEQVFPDAVRITPDGEHYIDRTVLGRIVFHDRAKKKQLEDILHPMVRAESDSFVAAMQRSGRKIAALDIPLLFETSGEARVDVTICVSAPKEIQKERVLARAGMTSEKFERIVAGQMTDADKRERADYVVESDKSLEDMKLQLQRIIDKIRTSRIHPKRRV
jgi:dephospho-CoA kinase